MTTYEYDNEMIKEMCILMNNVKDFYDCIMIVKGVYGSKPPTKEIIAHASFYAMNIFKYIWAEHENKDYFLQAEYFKACFMCIPDLW